MPHNFNSPLISAISLVEHTRVELVSAPFRHAVLQRVETIQCPILAKQGNYASFANTSAEPRAVNTLGHRVADSNRFFHGAYAPPEYGGVSEN